MKTYRTIRLVNYLGFGALGMIGTALAQNSRTTSSVHAEFRTIPAEVRAGQPVRLAIAVKNEKGNPVRDLQVVHEKQMHLIVVSTDLSEFAHLHPQQTEAGDFQVAHTFQHGGDYLLFADFTPPHGGARVDKFQLNASGSTRPTVAFVESAASMEIDGVRVTMTIATPLRAKAGTLLHFALFDAGTGMPVTDLQPYLGALAHFVIISQDGEEFLHAHPLEKSGSATRHDEHSNHGANSHQHGAKAAGNSEVSAHTTFPRHGLYKVWAQFQRGGRVITAPFTIRVGE